MSDQVDLKRCAHCGAWIPGTATMCASCGTSDVDGTRTGGPRRAAPRPAAVRLPRGWTVSRVLIWMNVAYLLWALRVQFAYTPNVSVLEAVISPSGMNRGNLVAGAYIHNAVVRGQWWRIFTAFFLHAGLIHIGMNMFVLARIGPFLEEIVGPVRFLVIYLVSGICSTLAISFWFVVVLHTPGAAMMLGASGAIFGVLGALAAYALRAGNMRGRALGKRLWRDIAFMLFIGWIIPMVSNTGHVGGLLPGALFGLLIGSRFTDRVNPPGQRPWLAAAAFLSALTLVALAHGVYYSIQSLGGR